MSSPAGQAHTQGTSPECEIIMNEDHAVNAAFEKLLSVNEGSLGTVLTINGLGFGTRKGKVLVRSMPAKIARGGWSDTRINCTIANLPYRQRWLIPWLLWPTKYRATLKAPLLSRTLCWMIC